jgi:RimJ/RimL family protein N-acetyltransferase
MPLRVSDDVLLTAFEPADKYPLVRYLNDYEIYRQTLRIPFPYTDADAEQWFEIVAAATRQQKQPVNWAIRHAQHGLIGGIGFDGLRIGQSHRAEIGYWLARPYWGQGIMTSVVLRVCQHGFAELQLQKITAHVFATNAASARVLQKCGFQQEGHLRRHYLKDRKLIDAILYAKLRDG